MRQLFRFVASAAFIALAAAGGARADAVTDWNLRTAQIANAAGLGTPPANRLMALVQTAAYEAANAVTRRYPADPAAVAAPAGALAEAAVAAAHHVVLTRLVPAQKTAIDAAYQQALGQLPAGPGRDAGVAVGEKAATDLMARRAVDKVVPETYRPHAAPGVYVPTVIPAATQWGQRTPWLLASPAQFRPGPPPDLKSERWARDFNEIKAVGGRTSTLRTPEQTAMASFWEATLPPIYHGMVHCVAEMPGRDLTQNARLFAIVAQAIDDALIAVLEAKYHYGFWRPVTAIRNAEIDGNDATAPDPSWLPLVETPMHPEYPCAHCTLAGAVATVLKAETAGGPAPRWQTTSSYVKTGPRSWGDLDAFVQEVAMARIYDGVHYRFSTEAGVALGSRVGEAAVRRFYPAR